MSLFLRRRLQEYLDGLAAHLPPAAISQLVKGLNAKKGVSPLGHEWEVVILWGLTRTYSVEYESGHPNAPKLDLRVCRHGESSPLFVADMRCVSDLGRHQENPVDRLSHLLGTAKLELGLGGGLSWEVKGHPEGPYRDAKMQLWLPEDDDAWDSAEKLVRSFVTSCKQQSARQTLDLSELAPCLSVSFDPAARGISGGYPSYTTTYSVRRNPVANALRNKARQAQRAGASGFTGTFLCDGGCQLLHERHTGGDAVKLHDVILNYLRQTRAVDFVATFAVESSHPWPLLGKQETHVVKPHLFSLRDPQEIEPVRTTLYDLASQLPPAETSPANAHAWYAAGCGQVGFRREPMKMQSNRVSISARWLMELLAGRISVEAALKEYGIDGQGGSGMHSNPFRRFLEEGRLPKDVRVSRAPDSDDDAIVFEFGAPDAAIAPFRNPT